MDLIINCLLVLVGVFVSGKIARATHFPAPMVQIAVGAAIAYGTTMEMAIEPHTFMFLFLSSLLFLDGSRLPLQEVRKDGFQIISLAFGLVFGTAIVLGYLLNGLLPGMPLAVCIGFAAIVSLTDPTAVSAVAQRVPIPHRMMSILEGESLLNDAAGLVCLGFAIMAATTGVFVLEDAAKDFTFMVFWGLAIGVLTTMAFTIFLGWFNRRHGENPHDQVIATLLMAFGSFWLAEQVHASGVLASVGAGVTLAILDNRGIYMATTRVRRRHFWDTVQYALNGAIFVIMGEQIPRIVSSIDTAGAQAGHAGAPWWLAVYVVGIFAFLVLSRFLWVWLTSWLDTLRHRDLDTDHDPSLSMRACLAMALAGVRGAVTLAGILSIPVFLPGGTPFPGRELAVVLAFGTILLSLVVSAVLLPLVLKGMAFPEGHGNEQEERQHRLEAARAAMAAIDEAYEALEDKEHVREAMERALSPHNAVVVRADIADESDLALERREALVEAALRLAGVRAVRDHYLAARRGNRITDTFANTEIHSLDLAEARLLGLIQQYGGAR
jgi:CPA1 family monovalent cation:H+ antiporter